METKSAKTGSNFAPGRPSPCSSVGISRESPATESSFPEPSKLTLASRENCRVRLPMRSYPYVLTWHRRAKRIAMFSKWLSFLRFYLRTQRPAGTVLVPTERGHSARWSILKYRRTRVITGNVDGCQLLLQSRFANPWRDRGGSLMMPEQAWRRLATGFMGPVELFESQGQITHGFEGGVMPKSMTVSESSVHYSGYTAAEREALDILRDLEPNDQSAALRMLRGLEVKDSAT